MRLCPFQTNRPWSGALSACLSASSVTRAERVRHTPYVQKWQRVTLFGTIVCWGSREDFRGASGVGGRPGALP